MLHQPTTAFADYTLADFMDADLDPTLCGGARCFSCPFFIPGNASREGKSCASCPMRLFSLARGAAGYLARIAGKTYDRVTGHLITGEPSDSHPQEEMTPDYAFYRPLSFNNPTWTWYWPELTV